MPLDDLRLAWRALRHVPSLTAISVLTVALGIGAGTSLFSVVKAVLLNPLPYPQPERLAWIDEVNETGRPMAVGYPNFDDWRRDNRSFAALAAFAFAEVNIEGLHGAERINGAEVTPEFFDVMGVKPQVGRVFSPAENRANAGATAILGHGLWQRAYGGDARILGSTIRVYGMAATVIGVMPAGFDFPEQAELWLSMSALGDAGGSRTGHNFRVTGRLRPGVSLEQAQTNIGAIARRLKQQYPSPFQGKDAAVVSLLARTVGKVRDALLMLFGTVGFVVLIVCVNVANLLLVRVTTRARELAVRTAMGAGRGHLFRQFLTESLVLSMAGGALGLVLAFWSMDLLRILLPADLPRAGDIRVDGGVVAFALALSAATGLLFGLLPAWRAAGMNVNDGLKSGARSHSAGRQSHRTQAALVISEVCLSLVLVAGAGLLINSFARLRVVDPGFRSNHVLTAGIWFADGSPKNISKFRELLQQVRAIPGVEAAGTTSALPFSRWQPDGNFHVEQLPDLPKNADAVYAAVTPGYFRAMGIPLLRGRDFTDADSESSGGVAIVSADMARRFWGTRDPLGDRVWFNSFEPKPHWLTVVGVAADVKQTSLATPAEPQAYVCLPQSQLLDGATLVIRTPLDPAGLAPAVRTRLAAVDPQMTYKFSTMDQIMAQALARLRFQIQVLGAFAALALLLAAVGLYGVLSYTVSSNRAEIGIRLALGAQPVSIFRMITGRALGLAAAGAGMGLAGFWGVRRVLASLLYGVRPGDPATLAAAVVLLLVVALAASWFPARRAMRVDPMTALREE